MAPVGGYLGQVYSVPSPNAQSDLSRTIAVLNHLSKCVKDGKWNNARNGRAQYGVEISQVNPGRISKTSSWENERTGRTAIDLSSFDWSKIERKDLSEPLTTALDDLKLEINSYMDYIAGLSLNFIHSDELILTVGKSNTVYNFLKYAAKKNRQFRVIVCEGFPDNQGHRMAEDLSADGISVILVPDSHVFGLMARVNKVAVPYTPMGP
ncbi:hypothetical protein AAHC03_0600 [Spirometra sp. Aus1]